MLIVLQFPIADMRRLLDGETGRISVPSWPRPKADDEFIHSFGQVRQRRKGALGGWASEGKLCMADRALRIPPDTPGARDLLHRLRFRVAFRTFFFNGETTGKFEIGITDKRRAPADDATLQEAIQALLDLPVSIPNRLTGEPYRGIMADAGRYLARHYLAATTKGSHMEEAAQNAWWVRAGEPVIVVERIADEGWASFDRLEFSDNGAGGAPNVEHGIVRYAKGRSISTWVCTAESLGLLSEQEATEHRNKLREMRIALLRVHAEREGLLEVLRCLDRGRMKIDPRSTTGQRLQYTLRGGLKRIGRDGAGIDHPVLERAIGLDVRETPGVRESVLDGMRPYLQLQLKGMLRGASGLSGEQYGQLHAALCAAFTLEELAILLRVKLEERLDVIADTSTLGAAVSDVIDWAERTGHTEELVFGAKERNPNNPALQALVW